MEIFIAHAEHWETESSTYFALYLNNIGDAGKQHHIPTSKCDQIVGGIGKLEMKKKVRDLRKRVNKESDYGLIVFLILAGCFLVASTVASVYYFN